MPEQGNGFDEVAAVADKVPVTRKSAKLLHRGEVKKTILKDFVRRMRIVNHLPIGVVANDRRAAQSFEYAHLNFLRGKSDQPIEAICEAFE
jgi:hypothetical protein